MPVTVKIGSNNYTSEQIVEIVNMSKSKPITKEERKELLNLIGR
jgi:hypothetical protein